jgi:hypothetical protein
LLQRASASANDLRCADSCTRIGAKEGGNGGKSL